MIISIKNKYIYISNPKTGSQSIRDFLIENDKSTSWNSFAYNGIKYFIPEHARARDIEFILGKNYKDFYIFTFIRDPYKKAVSGYFFYRNTEALKVKHMKSFKHKVLRILNVIIAKTLPFGIWILIKPLKTNKEFVTNINGQIIVNYIGLTERISDDMDKIFKELKLPFKGSDIIKKNISSYNRQKNYFDNRLKNIFNIKYKKDIAFYDRLKNNN